MCTVLQPWKLQRTHLLLLLLPYGNTFRCSCRPPPKLLLLLPPPLLLLLLLLSDRKLPRSSSACNSLHLLDQPLHAILQPAAVLC
jgi:hypothetical protein